LHHGEAVAIGLVVAGHIACARGLWPAELLAQSVQILKRCGLPVAAPEVCEEAFLHSLHLDKKKRAGRLRYVLPLAPGCCLVVDDVSDEEILSAAAASRAATIGPDDRADDRAVDRGENGCASW
jgi:3-dehydroquinate synthase